MSSSAHHLDDLNWQTRRYSKSAAYARSKLANLLFIQELAKRGIRAYATDPGMADTGITRDMLRYADGQHNSV